MRPSSSSRGGDYAERDQRGEYYIPPRLRQIRANQRRRCRAVDDGITKSRCDRIVNLNAHLLLVVFAVEVAWVMGDM